jgi:uncharacterized protein GlcG (DUF336 family)
MMRAADERPGRPIAVAVVDPRGDLICFSANAEVNTALARQNAIKKAFTSACMRVNTQGFAERAKSMGMAIADFGQPNFTGGGGGIVITRPSDGLVLGGLGVSGRTNEEDQELAEVGLQAVMEALRGAR